MDRVTGLRVEQLVNRMLQFSDDAKEGPAAFAENRPRASRRMTVAAGYPSDGIRVVDLSQIYNGPYADIPDGDGGAEVIKIEPLVGEHLRRRGVVGGAGAPFACSRQQRDVTLTSVSERPRAADLDGEARRHPGENLRRA